MGFKKVVAATLVTASLFGCSNTGIPMQTNSTSVQVKEIQGELVGLEGTKVTLKQNNSIIEINVSEEFAKELEGLNKSSGFNVKVAPAVIIIVEVIVGKTAQEALKRAAFFVAGSIGGGYIDRAWQAGPEKWIVAAYKYVASPKPCNHSLGRPDFNCRNR